MIMALLWLTISLPFVYQAQQKLALHGHTHTNDFPFPGSDEESNPLTSTTEEKTPAGTSFSEEYLHHTAEQAHPWISILKHHRDFQSAEYVAYHGELLSPPPES